MVPKVFVVGRVALGAWGGANSFNLTFDETSNFIHDLQDAMISLRHLAARAEIDFFVLVVPKKESK